MSTIKQDLRDLQITAKQASKIKMNLPDSYNCEALTISQIGQLIEQTAPYTDFLVMSGLMEWSKIKALEKKGFYVNTLNDQRSHRSYTIIRWDE